jgi:hypothetical protein
MGIDVHNEESGTPDGSERTQDISDYTNELLLRAVRRC